MIAIRWPLVAGSLLLATSSLAEERIERVETGLREFEAPHQMLTTEAAPEALHTLTDRMAHYSIPGVSIALIEDYELAWARGYGSLSAEGGPPVDSDTIFQAASTTKFLVAALSLELVAAARLALDEDVNEILRAWQLPENEFTIQQKVTLRRLLTHQAGLNRPDGGFSSEGGQPTLLQTLLGQAPATNPAAELISVPGEAWNYSNFGYLVVQLILEEELEASFVDIAEERLFDPLGMHSSTLRVPLSQDLSPREALPHDPEGNTHSAQLDPHAVANGGLMTTPSDLARFTVDFLRACRGDGATLISTDTATQMLEAQVDLGAMLGFPIQEGLGVFVCGKDENLTFLHPGDNMPGASCFLLGIPSSGDGVVIMTNGARGNMLALEILYAITRVYGWPTAQFEMG